MSLTKKFSTGKKVALIIIISVIVIIILSLFIFKFFSGSMGEHSFDEENLKAQGMVAVEATVTDYLSESINVNDDDFNNYLVSYYVDDKPYSSILKGDQTGISIGDKFTAYYNPNDPSDIIRPLQSSTTIIFTSIIAFSFITFILPIVAVIVLIVVIVVIVNKQKREVINRGEYNNPYNYNNINNPTYNNPYNYNNINNNNSNSPTYYNPYDYNNNDDYK